MALSLCSPTFVPCLTSPSPSFSFNNGKVFSLPSLVSAFHGIRLQNRFVKTAAPLSSRTGRARMLIRAAKREEEVSELRSKTTEELNEEVIDLKGELFVLRLQRSARQEFKSSEFRRMRKRIARILTIKRERD
ncbi:hypothetical protein HPP92_013107 [Vanilla planifolia]|uniref:Large ribosomal subunit protein uL29c n=1 Tax=Vanilla planifolia TaxID=51239 RepID=A0A835QSD5_VANPL|nr:hypothetical protein HPP92_013107 [Vanilla planifolia]